MTVFDGSKPPMLAMYNKTPAALAVNNAVIVNAIGYVNN
jgi:hypothetical protein